MWGVFFSHSLFAANGEEEVSLDLLSNMELLESLDYLEDEEFDQINPEGEDLEEYNIES